METNGTTTTPIWLKTNGAAGGGDGNASPVSTIGLEDANSTQLSSDISYNVTAVLLVHCPAAVIIDRAVTPVWYVIGVVGNILSARIWLQRRMWQSNSSAIYLSAISIVDLIFILLHIVMELKYAWAIHSFRFQVVCETYYVLFMAMQYLSPTLVLCFTVERYIAVCHPFRKEQFCTSSRAVKVVVGAIVCCTSLAAIQGYFWEYDDKTIDCRLRKLFEDEYSYVWEIWSWITEMTVFLIVPLIILIFNILVIHEVRKVSRLGKKNMSSSSKGSDVNGSTSATTVMLLSVSFYVILTTIPATLVYILMRKVDDGDLHMTDDQKRNDPTWARYFSYMLVRKIVDEICLSHYACNFILYTVTGVQFRRSLVELIGCSKCRRGRYSEVAQKKGATHAQTTHF